MFASRLVKSLFVLVFVSLLATTAHAQTTINVPCDTAAFVAAINTANGTPELDTLELAASCLYNFTTAADFEPLGDTALPRITTPIAINGNGATLQRAAGSPNFRLLYVSAGGDLALDNATVTGGSSNGGGIYVAGGTASIVDTTISGSTGGGIFSAGGSVTLVGSTVSGSAGAGIYHEDGSLTLIGSTVTGSTDRGIDNVDGTVTIIDSTLSGNNATNSGGAIRNLSGTLSIVNSEITGNSAAEYGGGIHNEGFGAVAMIANSLVAGNTAPRGGGIANHRTLSLHSSTIVGNNATISGGGLYTATAVTIANSIVWGNSTAIEGPGAVTVTDSIVEGGYAGAGNLDVNPLFVDPQPHASAPTSAGDYHILPLSPAVDAGSDAALPADTLDLDGDSDTAEEIPFDIDIQPRVLGAAVDMGADEQACPLYASPYTVPAGDEASLIAAIVCANVNPDENVIHLTSSAYSFMVPSDLDAFGDTALPRITTPITLYGEGATLLRAGGAPAFRLLRVGGGGSLTLNDVTISGGDAFEGGAVAVDAGAALAISGSTLSGNHAVWGGAIAGSGAIELTDSTLSGNSASSGGGAVIAYGILNIDGTTLNANSAVNGGALYTYIFAVGTISGSTFDDNDAGNLGGGILNLGALTITDSTISANTSSSVGGGIENEIGATLTVIDTQLIGNHANANGGGILNLGNLVMTRSTVTSNTAGSDGGGLFHNVGTLSAANSVFAANAAANGAGLNFFGGSAVLTNTLISGNKANSGGGGFFNNGGTVTMSSSTVSGNAAGFGGGALNFTSLTVVNSIFWGNTGEIAAAPATVTYSIIQGGYAGTGNLNADPQFLSPVSFASAPTTAGNYHIRAGSPAVNTGSSAALPADTHDLDGDTDVLEPIPLDIDGDARVINGVVDMGADESLCALYASPYTVPAGDETALIQAITCANESADPNVIHLTESLYLFAVGDATHPDSALPRITTPITIYGHGATLQRSAGAPAFRLLFVDTGGQLTLEDVVITGGSEASGGAILVNSATLILRDSTVSGNSAASTGGAIYSSGSLNVIGSTLAANSAGGAGGAIFGSSGVVFAVNTTIAGNSAGSGGGIFCGCGLTVTNVTLSGNSAISGAGIYTSGSASVLSSTLAGNFASSNGGGLFLAGGSATVSNSILWGNTNAIFNSGGSLSVSYSDVQGGAGGTGNLNVDPLFVSPVSPASAPTAAGDYHLQPLSPVVNLGSSGLLPADVFDLDGDANFGEPLPLDRDGQARIIGPALDMGADEVDPCDVFVSPYTVAAGDEAGFAFAIRCANAAPDADVIDLTLSDYQFTAGDPTYSDSALPHITSPITINGSGATIQRTGGPSFRLLSIEAGGDLTLNDVTLSGGSSDNGGAIINHVGGVLTVNGSTITANTVGNSGGAIRNNGTLTISDSVITGNSAAGHGGGLNGDSLTTITVISSTISNNSAGSNGGGIFTGGTLTVTNSTISGNSAGFGGAGGGIYSQAPGSLTATGSAFLGNNAQYGGGIYTEVTATATNCTLSGNTATNGAALYNNGGATLTLTNCLITGNSASTDGGGIVSGGMLTVQNSTLAGNRAGLKGGGIYSNGAGTLVMTNSIVWGNNTQIQSDGTATVTYSAIQGGFAGTGNLNADPVFVSPVSHTLAPTTGGNYHLQSVSPAAGAGNNAALPPDTFDLDGDSDTLEALPYDIDGDSRIIGPTVDMGADEAIDSCELFVSPYMVAAGDEADLIFAVRCANITPEADAIELTPSDYQFSVGDAANSDSALPRITSPVTIDGSGATIERPVGTVPSFRLLYVGSGGDLTLSGVTIRGGVQSNGGGILNDGGTLTVLNSTITQNTAGVYGGGIYSNASTTVSGSNVTGNHANQYGGGIYNFDSPLIVTGSTLSANTANVVGGALFNHDFGTASITGSTIAGNTANGYGGGIFNVGDLTVVDSTLSANTSANGGALYNDQREALVIGSTITGNSASQRGGGFHNFGQPGSTGHIEILDSTFAGNSAAIEGGALYTSLHTLTIVHDSSITGNQAAEGGAARNLGTLTVFVSTIAGNNATTGGGFHNGASSALTVVNSIVWGNNGQLVNDSGAAIDISYSVVEGTLLAGDGNLNADPQFLSPAPFAAAPTTGGDYRLQAVSPALDAGNNTNMPTDIYDMDGDTDLAEIIPLDHAGNPRIFNGVVDMGAFERNAFVAAGSASVDVTEGGATDSYTIVLTSEPTADVIVTPTGDAQCTVSAPLTFTSTDWDTPQLVTVTAVNDDVAEGSHACAITHAIGSTDAMYDAFTLAGVSGAVTDNDNAGVQLSVTAVELAEGGATDSYTIALTSEPTADVIVTPTGDLQCDVSGALTFTAADWDTPQTVTVTAVDDDVDEADGETCTVTHSAGSDDPNYDGISVQSVTGTITDNDTAGVTVAPTSFALAEGGPSATYDLSLDSQPLSGVTITLSVPANCDATPAEQVWTAGNWDEVRTVTVSAVDDAVDDPVGETCTITHASVSADPKYNAIAIQSATGTIADNDTAGIELSTVTIDATEGGATGSYTIVLTSEPTADVVVTPTGDAQCTVSAPLTFTADDWDTPQTVTVTAVDDQVAEGEHTCGVTNTASSGDAFYHGIAIDGVTGTITDNDSAGVSVETSVAVTEGGAPDTYSVVLLSQPASDVTITPAGDADCDVGAALVFTDSNWMTPQAVNVTAFDDSIAEGPHACAIANTATSGDAAYDGIALDSVSGAVTDNDTAGIELSTVAIDATEGGTAGSYTVVLTSEPTADVVVTPTGDPDCSVSSTLTFTNADWMTPKLVTVSAIDDAVAEGEHTCAVTNTASSGDAFYHGIAIDGVTGTITDNDTAGVSVETSVAVTEGGTTDTYNVVLLSRPLADVTVTPTGDSQCTAGAALLFTDANWSIPQAVTVTAVDDALAEGAHTCTVTNAAASADPAYDGIAVASVTGAITDDDPFPAELLANGGFELHVGSNKVPDGWTVKNATADKLLCKPGKPHTGLCAFKFAGGVGEKAQLSQTVDLTGVTAGAGDTLAFSAYFKGNAPAAKTQIVLRVTYAGNPTPVQSKLTVKRNAAYTLVALPVFPVTAPVTQIKVTFKHKSTSGTVLIDDASLIHTIPGGRQPGVPKLLPLPDGFRQPG